MLNRNSNTSISRSQLPRGRKIENNLNVHIVQKGNNHSDQKQRKSLDYDDVDVFDFKKPLKLSTNKNKENTDTNIPMKKSLVKVESVKNISKLKKANAAAKSIVGHKKIDSARSSLSKRTKSQTNIHMKKQLNKKSLSPKSNKGITSRPTRTLLTQRQKTNKAKTQQRHKKNELTLNSSKNNNKKKKQFIEPLLILNDSSIQIARELENLNKNQIKIKKQTKKGAFKQQKKVIISEAVGKPKHLESLQRDSPQLITLTHKYKAQKKVEIGYQEVKGQLKHKHKQLIGKQRRQKQIRAAIVIQRAFRNYLHSINVRYIEEMAITIQRWWRSNQRARLSFNLPRLVAESSLVTIQDFSSEFENKTQKRLEISLADESKEQNIKERIKCLLEERDANQSHKFSKDKKIEFSPIASSVQQPEQNYKNLPLKIFSPKKLEDQSQDFYENLTNLQKVHKEKLMKNYINQKQTIKKLWEEKMCSPRAQEGRLRDLDSRLNKQLLRFQAGIKQVLRGISLTKKQHIFEEEEPEYLNSPRSSHNRFNDVRLNTSANITDLQSSFSKQQIKQIQDLSVQLSFVQDQNKDNKVLDLKFDPSLQGIELYVSGIFECFEHNPEWKKQFFQIMAQPRGISLQIIISNLEYAEGTDENNTFKIPLYKLYQDQLACVIPNQKVQQFNQKYIKLRNLPLSFQKTSNTETVEIGEYQYFHIQAVVDALNQEFNKQRIKNSLSLYSQKNRFEFQSSQTFYSSLSQAKQGILKSGGCLCGFIDDANEIGQTYLNKIKEQRLGQMLCVEMKNEIEDSDGQEQFVEMKVHIGEEVVMEMFEEAIRQIYHLIKR